MSRKFYNLFNQFTFFNLLLFILLLVQVSIVSAQSVTAPAPRQFSVSTSNQDASGFQLQGFNSSDNLLASVGLRNPPSGTTLSITTTTGLILSTGYSGWTNFTRLSFTGTMANINAALATLKVSTGVTTGAISITVSATINPTGYYYLPINGHFYKPVSGLSGASGGASAYTTVKNAAAATTYKGQTGYLITITSQVEQDFVQANVPGNNILIALTDEAVEGVWKWDTGPEAGTIIRSGGSNVSGQYNTWCGGEPNNAGSGEDYTVTKWNGGNCWNDYGPPATNFPSNISGYVIEYGTWSDPEDQTFSDFYSASVSNNTNGCPLASTTLFRYIKFEATYSSDTRQVNVHEIYAYSNGVNVALNKTATANGSSSNASGAVDGNRSTIYSSNRDNPYTSVSNPVLVIVDLGQDYTVQNIKVDLDCWEVDFKVYVSSDQCSWAQYGSSAVRFSGIWPCPGTGDCTQNPSITGFTPTQAGNGNLVVITGTNFNDVSSVKFGGTEATSFTVNSSTQISAVVGSGANGKITVSKPLSGGLSCQFVTATSGNNFTWSACSDPGTLSGTQSICAGLTSQFSSTVSGGTWSTSNSAVATVNASNGLVTAVAAGTATISYTISDGCSVPTRTVTVTAPPSAGTLSGTQAICSNGTSQLTSSGSSGGTWTTSDASLATVSATGLVTGVAAGTVTITYTVTGTGGCSNATANKTITLSAPPAAPPVITSRTQRICVGSTVQYEALSSSGVLAFDGTNDVVATANVAALNITSDITVEGWFKVKQYPGDWAMLVGKGDGGSNRTYGLWLQDNGTVLWQLWGSNGTTQVSSNTALELDTWYHIAANRVGNTTRIYINGVEDASTTYTGTPNSTTSPLRLGYGGIHYYYNGSMDEVRIWNVGRTATQILGNKNKSIAAQTGLIAYYKFNQGTADGTNTGLTIALDASGNGIDGTLSNFALSGSTSNWSSRSAQADGTWSSSNTAIATVDENGLVTGVAGGTATISFTVAGTGGCADASSTRTVTVNPAVVVNPVASQYVNTGGTTSPVTFTSPNTGATFSWTNSNTTIIPVSQASGNLASFSVSNTGTAPVSTTISVVATATANNLTCTGDPMTFQIVVNPVAVMDQPADQTAVCPGATHPAISFSSQNTGGTVTYSWTNDNTSIGLAASGTGTIPAFTATNTTSDYSTATITVTPTYTNGGTSNVGASKTFIITVKPKPSVAQVSNVTYCEGATGSVSFASPVSGTTYAWTNSNTAIGLAASGTGNITSFQTTNTITTAITGNISVTPTANSCVGSAMTFTITVKPKPTVNAIANQVYCAGSTATATTIAGPVTGTVFNWTNSNPAIGLAASGTGNVPSFTATNTGVAPAIGTITVTPKLGSGTSGKLAYTVYSTHGGVGYTDQYPGWANSPADFEAMFNTANSRTVLHSSGEANASTLLNFYDAGTLTTNGISLPAGADYFGLKILGTFVPQETGSYVFGVDGDDAVEISIDGVVVASFYGIHGAYGWYHEGAPINLVAGRIYNFMVRQQDGWGGEGLSVAWKRPSQSSLSLQTDELFGPACSAPAVSYTVIVNPIPTVNAVADQTLCAGTAASVTYSGAVTGTVYNWTNSNTAIGLAAGGTGDLSFIPTNTGTSPITATITVTPSYTNAGVTCTGTPKTFKIFVNPKGQVNAVSNMVLCNSLNLARATFATVNTGGTTTYAWTNTNTGIGLPASGTGNISFAPTNTSTSPITATITVTPSFSNGGTSCTGTPISFTVTVNPGPVVTTGTLPSTICISDTMVRLYGTPIGGVWTGIGTYGLNFIPSATAIGSYLLTYTYTDLNGCFNRATITANVLACEDRNRDLNNSAVLLYPNPNTGRFNIRVNSSKFNTLGMKVYNTSGQLISVKQWSGLVYGREIPVNLPNLSAGMYLVRLYYGDGMDRGADRTYQIIVAH